MSIPRLAQLPLRIRPAKLLILWHAKPRGSPAPQQMSVGKPIAGLPAL